MEISVNMFGLRLTIDAHPRSKKGHPPQTTTGVDKTSSIQVAARLESRCASGGAMPDMPRRRTGAVRTRLTQNRRLMAVSSGFGSSSAVTVRGSSAMPQIGQEPGSSLTISGCIGQVNSALLEVAGLCAAREEVQHKAGASSRTPKRLPF